MEEITPISERARRLPELGAMRAFARSSRQEPWRFFHQAESATIEIRRAAIACWGTQSNHRERAGCNVLNQTEGRPEDAATAAFERVISAIVESPGIVCVLGGPDSGKTTWVRNAARSLSRQGCLPLALLDADIGQASLGPPAAVALRLLVEHGDNRWGDEDLRYDALSFIGSVSPMGHALQMVAATKRLADRAQRAGAAAVLVDTTGLVTPGFGFQIKLRKIELMAPSHLVAFQRDAELEPLLSVVGMRAGVQVHRLKIAERVRRRSGAERSAYRARRVAAYFAGSRTLSLSAADVLIVASPVRRPPLDGCGADLIPALALRGEDVVGLLAGLNNADDHTLGLGWLEGVSEDGGIVYVRTPVPDASGVRILQLGSLRLDVPARS
ncbi:Clp1/GlmU family protein [Candidatus Nitrospira bockiana]